MNAPLVPSVQVLRGRDVLAHTDALRSVYTDAFYAPPWNEDEERAAEFAERLPRDARRPGFTAALAFVGRSVVGFADGWTTLPPFPADRWIPWSELENRLDEVPADRKVIAVCRIGQRSRDAARLLRAHGHPGAASLTGGLDLL